MSMPTWHGKKAPRKGHSSVIEAAMPIIKAAEKLDAVKRISPGLIKSIGGKSGEKRAKFLEVRGGLRVTISGGGVQTIYIYTSEPQQVREVLEKVEL